MIFCISAFLESINLSKFLFKGILQTFSSTCSPASINCLDSLSSFENNPAYSEPKDTIIATAHFWTLYYIIKYLKSENDYIRKNISLKIGIFIGLSFGNVVALFLEQSPVVPVDWVFYSLQICASMGIIFGLYPAIKASKLNPIDSMRFD